MWELREDIDTIIENALAAIGETTVNQFSCSWRGNPVVELGDKIAITTKDDDVIYAYLLNDSIEYSGGLRQESKWDYKEAEETDANPSTLGESLKQTFAKVDKQEKTITLLASETEGNTNNIATLQVSTVDIASKVESIEEVTTEAIDGLNESVATLTSSVEAKMSDEEVTLKINNALSNGVDKVETSTGFTFNEAGLNISKTGSEMTTQITEDGMQVFKNNEAVLTANNIGVDAVNLHATTYLIIGSNSRLEDYSGRTGCFWIGG